jgi:hypothetical protein
MADTSTNEETRTLSPGALVATFASVITGVLITQLLVPITKAHTPQWLWITDHCPKSDFACGSPQLGLFIPAAIATLMIGIPFLTGYIVATTDHEEVN